MKKQIGLFLSLTVLALSLTFIGCSNPADPGETFLPAPGNLRADTTTTRSIVIKWNTVGDAAGYTVYRKNGSQYKELISYGDSAVVSYEDEELLPGTSYTYRVNAFDSSGKEGYSAEKSLATKDPTAEITDDDDFVTGSSYGSAAALENALNIIISGSPIEPSTLTYNKVEIDWPAPSFTPSGSLSLVYNVYRRVDGSNNATLVGSTENNGFTDSSVSPDTEYVYEIRPVAVLKDEDGKITDEYESQAGKIEITGIKTEKDPGADLENSSPAADYITAGSTYLLAGDLDKAIASYERAYALHPTDAQAIIYSALAKLASIPKDQGVQNLMKNRFGLISYPNSLDKLIADDWFRDYVDPIDHISVPASGGSEWTDARWYDEGDWYHGGGSTGSFQVTEAGYYYYAWWTVSHDVQHITGRQYETQSNPALSVPTWFRNNGVYGATLINGLETATTWEMLLFANLLDKNTNGLNGVLDDVLNSVFGTSFEAVSTRIGELQDTDKVRPNAVIIEGFGLGEIFEEGVDISKTELNLLVASLRLIKATLEWVSSYNWETDLSFLKFNWETGEGLVNYLPASALPLRNNFLTARSQPRMDAARNDYIAAIGKIVDAYDHYSTSTLLPQAAKDEIAEYGWARTALNGLKTALTNKSVYTTPSELGATITINTQNLFTAGYLSLDNLIETETGSWGKAPKFYVKNNLGATTLVTDIQDIIDLGNYNGVGIKFKDTQFKGIITGNGLDDLGFQTEEPFWVLDSEVGYVIYAIYHGVSLEDLFGDGE